MKISKGQKYVAGLATLMDDPCRPGVELSQGQEIRKTKGRYGTKWLNRLGLNIILVFNS